jgi:hypothetical protein
MGSRKYLTNWDLKHDKKRYPPGATVELDEKVAKPLLGGVLSEVTTPATAVEDGQLSDEELAALGVEVKGGGYYVLPSGEPVRGRAKVLAWAEEQANAGDESGDQESDQDTGE